MNSDRRAASSRKTLETDVRVELNLDGRGDARVSTGVGFFDHMLQTLARHAAFDLVVEAQGDLHVDAHHTVEDVGLVLGDALGEALGDKRGIARFGHATIPMEDALVTAAVDLSGRPFLCWRVNIPASQIGGFDTELVEEFWRAVVNRAAFNLHVLLHHGTNSHHIVEATFKGVARALRMAVSRDDRSHDVPSTKGAL